MRDWPKKRMSEITSLITDGKHGDCENEENSGYYFLSSKDLREGKLHYDDAREIRHSGFIETHRRTNLQPGDILLANCGASIGRVGLAQNDTRIYKTTFQKSISVIKPKKEIVNNKYLYYFILCNNSHLIDLGGGTAQPNLLISDLKKIKIPLPPIRIQKKIAAVLSAYDDLIENNNRRIAILGKMAEELYREWFVRLRFPGHEKVKIVKGVPEGWEVKNLNKVSKNYDGKRIPLSSMEREKMRGSIPYFGAAKIIDYIDKYIFDGKYLLIAEDGSVVTDDGYPVLQFVNEKFWVNNHTHILQGIDDVFSTEWLYLSLLKYPISGLITGAAQPKITQANLNKIMLLTPKKDVLINFNSKVNPIIDLKTRLLISTNNLKTSRDRLLSRLMSGKIDAENMDIQFPTSMRCAEPVEAQEESVHA